MRWAGTVGAIFLAMVLDATWLQWLSPDHWGKPWVVTPHLTLMVVIYRSFYHGPVAGGVIGLAAGLLQDLYWSQMLGPAMGGMMAAGWLAGRMSKWFQPGIWLMALLAPVLDGLYGFWLYGVNLLFTNTQMSAGWFVLNQWGYSVLANTLLGLLVVVTGYRLQNIVKLMRKEEEGK